MTTMAKDKVRRQTYSVAAALLDYPGTPLYREHLRQTWEWVQEQTPSRALDQLLSGLNQLFQMEPELLEQHYVHLFDFSKKASLHLTAHELGDSQDRGGALLQLREVLRQSGFEQMGSELPDYLPLLFEWLSVKPDDVAADKLEGRISAACANILEHLGESEPYGCILRAVAAQLPEPCPYQDEHKQQREQGADMGEMPYPIQY